MKPENKYEKELIGAMIGLAKACYVHEKQKDTDALLVECLVSLGKQNDRGEDHISMLCQRVREEKAKVAPDCANCFNPCGNTEDYDLNKIWQADPEIREGKLKILSSLLDYAEKMKKERVLESEAAEGQFIIDLLYRGLSVLSYDIPVERLRATLEDLLGYCSGQI